jgi:hypothetical protein
MLEERLRRYGISMSGGIFRWRDSRAEIGCVRSLALLFAWDERSVVVLAALTASFVSSALTGFAQPGAQHSAVVVESSQTGGNGWPPTLICNENLF